MIPILYKKDATNFSNNGLGFLKDAIKATVTEERNGSYELSLQYPITGQWYDQITDGCIIKAKANETSKPQLFRIYKTSKPLKGIVTYSAEHISYDLNGLPLAGFSIASATPQMAIKRALESTPLPHDFTAVSDISTLNSTKISAPCSVRALLGGQRGSVLDVWGGEYEFDNFVVKLHAHRGANNGVSIEYGKNLKDIKQESNIAECYTHFMPYAVYNLDDGEGNTEEVYVYLSEEVLPLKVAENIGHYKAYIMDFSDRFGDNEIPTEEALRAKATAYIESANLGTPKVSITVSFVQLWQTEEYKNIAPLERVSLCDTVAVRFLKLGVTASAKVIKIVYDSLNEKYESIELGDAKSSFADTVNNQQAAIDDIRSSVKNRQAETTEAIKKAIEKATGLITGHSGGYVVLNPAEMPQEILILDKPTIEEAVNVWRWNSGGLGFSSTGYNGKFTTAITMDGSIVADFISAGQLNGALLKADSIQASSISAAYRDSQVTKSNLVSEINLSEGLITLNSNRLVINSDNFTLTKDGSVTASNVSLDGSLKTVYGNNEYYTHIHEGAIEQFYGGKRISYIMPVGSSEYAQLGILGSNNYSGIMIGGISNSAITMYYQCNLNTAYTTEGCRHHFVGTVKFDDKVVSNIDFNSNYGLSWNGNIGLRYATTSTGVDRAGIWLGSDSYYTSITGSRIYINGDPRITGDIRFFNAEKDSAPVVMSYDWGNDALNVGNSSRNLWLNGKNIYANGSPISTSSDERKKNDIQPLGEKYLRLIKAIQPVSFKYNGDIAQSGRTHTGFIAQNVFEQMDKCGLTAKDFAAFVDLNNDGEEYALRYEEFVPLVLMYAQSLESRLEALERRSINA